MAALERRRAKTHRQQPQSDVKRARQEGSPLNLKAVDTVATAGLHMI
jgi:hypothetical protein